MYLRFKTAQLCFLNNPPNNFYFPDALLEKFAVNYILIYECFIEFTWHNSSGRNIETSYMVNHENRKVHEMANIVDRNINALISRRKEEESQKTLQSRIVDKITAIAGSMGFVYFHFVLFGLWIIWNLGWLQFKPFDQSFILLGTTAAIEAIFLSTFVLISQNNMNLKADKRAELDLQVSLLTEHEVTRIITLVTAIARKAGLDEIINEEIEELAKDIQPEKVMDKMENATKENV